MSLLSRLFGRAAPTDPGPRPDGPVSVIGDIHGRIDLLDQLLGQMPDDGTTVFVGDLIDRGDQSRAVLERIAELTTGAPGRFVCLMGNHEKMMLDFIDRTAERGGRWLRNGGLQTLASFGVSGVTDSSEGDLLLDARDDLRAALDPALEDWMRALPLSWRSGTLWCVHAAADPARPMTDQDPRVLLWGHRDFLSKPRRDGQWVAHGHTPVDTPAAAQSRIPTDTGAYYSGRLTAAHIRPGGAVTFLPPAG